MITTIGVSFILFNVILLTFGPQAQSFPILLPTALAARRRRRDHLQAASCCSRSGSCSWSILSTCVKRTTLGKAMRATAQDAEAARMMGIDVDRVIVLTFFLGSALAGAAELIFGLYYSFTSFIIGYTAGLRAFTAAVLGGIGSIPGAMLGGL